MARVILAAGALILTGLTLHPPYFAIDRASGGRVHASVGHHWIWDPPSAAEVYEKLTKGDSRGVDPARLAACEVRINTVRLAGSIVVLGAAIAAGLALSRRGGKR